jgi:hypothetical protein
MTFIEIMAWSNHGDLYTKYIMYTELNDSLENLIENFCMTNNIDKSHIVESGLTGLKNYDEYIDKFAEYLKDKKGFKFIKPEEIIFSN